MIEGIINDEKELISLIRKDLKKSGKEIKFYPTQKQLKEQIEIFMSEDVPKTYPVYMYIDFTILLNGLGVDLLTTTNILTKDQLLKYADDIEKIEKLKFQKELDEIKIWLNSDEGRKKIKEGFESTEKEIKRLFGDINIDYKTLTEPFTI
jgi:hypothetical protein